MPSFSIQTLGCKVNHYESEQIATFLRSEGWQETQPASADLCFINTCSVTTEAGSKSRQSIRRTARLPVLPSHATPACPGDPRTASSTMPAAGCNDSTNFSIRDGGSDSKANARFNPRARVVVIGCWATSHRQESAALDGVRAVITHHDNVRERLTEILAQFKHQAESSEPPLDASSAMLPAAPVQTRPVTARREPMGMHTLPVLSDRQVNHQRAMLKVQDGCDAHCTYCIIPSLRPQLWSKPIAAVVEEARRLVDAGHREIVLTGIFLGAYGHPTALRRRQAAPVSESGDRLMLDNGPFPEGKIDVTAHIKAPPSSHLAQLIDALCTSVPGMARLRLSSLEPGDLDDALLSMLRSHEQVVPHFHLPLQSGSNALLRRMNRQYSRDDFLRLIDRVSAAFDRPALTTDIIVGFPGESDAEFDQTLEVARRARFIHVHAFPFSARPGTAAARWTKDFIRGPVVGQRIDQLKALSDQHSLDFRRGFVGQTVRVMVEREDARDIGQPMPIRHGRCERYFQVHFDGRNHSPGELVHARIGQATPGRTWGNVVSASEATTRLGRC